MSYTQSVLQINKSRCNKVSFRMTVTYSNEAATCSGKGIGIFLKLLIRWKGSIYKIIWVDLLLYLAIYYSLNILYLYGLDEQNGRKIFVKVVTSFSTYGSAIPLSFVLGFFVNVIYNRWWSQYCDIPYPDNIAILVGASAHGNDDKSRIIRRTIIRYVCLAFTLTLSMISPKVKKRFPTYNHFVQAGLLNKEEKKLIEDLNLEYPTSCCKYWLPLAWAANVATRARSEGIIKDELGLKDILEQINEFREKCKKLWDYDWICVPLVYTQVVTLAVYLYFLFTVIGTQFVEEVSDGEIFFFQFPFMSCIEFFFYMGWLKVAESLMNPFGEDDDDFEVVWMIDRHLIVGYLLVDKIHKEHPKLRKDLHWNQIMPSQLPFTVASQKYMDIRPEESTNNIYIKTKDQDLIFRKELENVEDVATRRGKNPLKDFFCRKKSSSLVPLKKVAVQTDEIEEEDWDEVCQDLNEDTSPDNRQSSTHVPSIEEFNSLRRERLDKKKEELFRLLDLLKNDKDKAKESLDKIIK